MQNLSKLDGGSMTVCLPLNAKDVRFVILKTSLDLASK